MLLSKKLLGILFLAFLLRVIGIHFGLPALYHQDEPKMVNHAMAIGATGDWNTHYFVIPPFVSYFLFVLYGAYFLIGRALTIFPSADEFALHFFRDPTAFYLIGRGMVGVLFGVLTVWLVGKSGAKYFSPQAGLWAALFLALSLVHVQYSHYIYADSPVTFALTLLCFWHLKLLEEPTMRHFIWMGIILGWAASIKYTALYFLPTTFFCYALVYGRNVLTVQALRNILAAGLASFITFACFAPYTFLDWPGFYSTFLHQSQAQGYVGIAHYLRYTFINGTSIVLVLLSGAGILFGLRSRSKETQALGVFVLSFYLINTWAGQSFSRYALPIVPILCLWAGMAMDTIGDLLRGRRWLFRVLAGVAVLSLLVPTVYSDWLYIQKDTRTQCAEWFAENVVSGSVIVMDSRFYGPHLKQTGSQLEEKMKFLDGGNFSGVKAKRLELEKRAIQDKESYRIYTLWKGKEGQTPEFLVQHPFVGPDPEAIRRIGTQYLVLNYIGLDPDFHKLTKGLEGEAKLIATFSPYRDPDKKISVDTYSSTAAPHLPEELFSRRRLGPYLEVYAIKGS